MDSKNHSREGFKASEKLQADALEALQDARESGLFVGLSTEEHLEYHRRTALAEYSKLSAAGKSLSHEHLELLRIPPVNITEQWSVPSRIASIIENACNCLSDDQLKLLKDKLWTEPVQMNLWMEPPLLSSDNDQDCAELQRTVNAIISSDISNVREHGLPIDKDDVVAIPPEAYEIAAKIEEDARTEAMVVSVQTIQFITQLMESMKWKNNDREDFVLEQLAFEPMRIHITPPLSPLPSPFREFIPDEDICITSEVSELSSHLSEALENAELVINKKYGDIWPENTTPDIELPEVIPDFEDVPEWPVSPVETALCAIEDELPVQSHYGNSVLQLEHGLLAFRKSNISEKQSQPLVINSELEERFEQNFSDSLLDFQFEELTAEGFCCMDDSALLASQARIPIPDTENDPRLPEWETETSDAAELFLWIREHNKEAFQIPEWTPPEGLPKNQAYSIFPTEAEFDLHNLDESFQGCISPEEKLDPFLPDAVPFDYACLMSSDWHQEELGKIEEFLEKLTDEPMNDITSADITTWDTLIHRRKRRRLEDNSLEVPKSLDRIANFKAPELLLGVGAFSQVERQQTTSKKFKPAVNSNKDRPSVSEVGYMTETSLPHPPINIANTPSRVVLSTGVPQSVRTHMLHLLPDLKFVERDYQNRKDRSVTDDEADIVSLSAGIVITTMIGFRQSGGSQKTSAFQQRVVNMSEKYERLHILIYRSQRPGVDDDGTSEFSPSDAMAYAQLHGLARNLPTDISVLYISGGERMVAQWAASLVCTDQPSDEASAGALLTEVETPQELFLRRSGLNVYDAQVVMGMFLAPGNSESISRFTAMSPDERRALFGSRIGCQRALETIGSRIQA